jgi:hypothetical protein
VSGRLHHRVSPTRRGVDTTLVPGGGDLRPCKLLASLGKVASMSGQPSTPESVFADSPTGLVIYHRVLDLLADLDVRIHATRSQVALLHRTGFAYLWYPGRYVRSEVPAVLSLALPERLDSPRFKQVGNPSPGVWMHHLELDDPAQVDTEVVGWLHEAYAAAD